VPIVQVRGATASGAWNTHATISTLASNTSTLVNDGTVATIYERPDSIWTGWINDDARSTYITQTATSTVWTYWATSTTTCATVEVIAPGGWANVRVSRPPEPALTDAERAAAQARRDAVMRREREHQAELVARAEAAEKRAEQLLVENLSLKQREEYLRHKAFTVHGRIARYRIRRGRSGNVDVVNEQGILTHRLCAHPRAQVPDCDTMLAQKLMLEHDEHAFVRRANVHPALSGHQRVMEPLH
jgi:hypothetical protein